LDSVLLSLLAALLLFVAVVKLANTKIYTHTHRTQSGKLAKQANMSQVTGNGTSLELEKGKVRVKGGKRGSSSGKFRKVFTRKISLKIKAKKKKG